MKYNLPASVPCSWSDEALKLRFEIPKIWSQASSRQFGLYWSDALSYGRLWPEPTNAELNAFHDIPGQHEYSGGKKKSSDRGGLLSRLVVKLAWLNDRGIVDPTDTIMSLTEDDPEVCDIGCGVGTFLSAMRERGAVVTGIDPSGISAQALAAKGIEFYFGVAESLPTELDGRIFDVVTMLHCLTCCRDPARAVANASALLKPDGMLVIEVSNMDCLGFQKYGPAWWHTDAGRNMHFFTKRSLTKLLALVGAVPIKWEYRGFVTQFTPSWIEHMGRIWDGIDRPRDIPRPSFAASAIYLPRALISSAAKKYEAIRVYARIN